MDTPNWVKTLDSVTNTGQLTSAELDDGDVVIKFFAGRVANTYYTLRIPLDAIEVEQR